MSHLLKTHIIFKLDTTFLVGVLHKTPNAIMACIIFTLLLAEKVSTKLYAGNFGPNSNGVTGLISTPVEPLQLINAVGSGESNWVSIYYIESQDFSSWMQSGWLFYIWSDGPDHPKQY